MTLRLHATDDDARHVPSARFERYPLTFGPTPIEHLPRLSAALGGGVQVYAKRDDCNSGLAIGGNKLRVSRLRATGVEVSVRTLFEHPTVGALARTPQIARTRVDATVDPFAVMLPLRSTGTLPPLFCIHPGGGLGWTYRTLLKHIDARRPVYAIQSRGIRGEAPLPTTVREMASDYVGELRAAQPTGPYHLLGWSFGGEVAHCMATQLQGAGETVALLALIDSRPAPVSGSLDPVKGPAPLPRDAHPFRDLLEAMRPHRRSRRISGTCSITIAGSEARSPRSYSGARCFCAWPAVAARSTGRPCARRLRPGVPSCRDGFARIA